MKKLILILIALITVFSLASCGDDVEIPDGMQLVSGGADKGYYFFAPEEWTVGKEMNGISYVYASRVDTTSLSFVEIDPKSFVKPDPAKSDVDFFLEDYFESLKSEFPEKTKFAQTNGKKILLGSNDTVADKAVQYNYSYFVKNGYTDAEQDVGFMQILAVNDGRFYILTYAASLAEKSDGVTTYDFYQEKIQAVIDNFKFIEKTESADEKVEYHKDSDGDILASDKNLAGFSLYVPNNFNVDYSSAIVSATHSDGSNITMTRATATGVNLREYWEFRKSELSAYVDSITEITENGIAEITLANAQNAAVCEYTYVYGEKTFHVYQIYCVEGGILGTNLGAKGYIFTYTAAEDNYNLHFGDIERILEKVNF